MEVKTMVRISVKLKIHNFIKFTLGQRRSDILQPWDLQTGLSITRSIKLQSDTYYKVEWTICETLCTSKICSWWKMEPSNQHILFAIKGSWSLIVVVDH